MFVLKIIIKLGDLPAVLQIKIDCAKIPLMKKPEKVENIKEKVESQIDSIIEKKPIDNIKLPLPAKIFAVMCIVQCVITAPLAYNYIAEFI